LIALPIAICASNYPTSPATSLKVTAGSWRSSEDEDLKRPDPDALAFLSGGDMGAAMRAVDWTASPLGAAGDWPVCVKTAVSVYLNSRFCYPPLDRA
jgi:hypothetical protein